MIAANNLRNNFVDLAIQTSIALYRYAFTPLSLEGDISPPEVKGRASRTLQNKGFRTLRL